MDRQIAPIAKDLGIELPHFRCPPIGQTGEELLLNLKIIDLLKPEFLVEIGSAEGGFIYMASAVMRGKGCRIITIDPYIKDSKYESTFIRYRETILGLKKEFPEIDYIHIRENSGSENALSEFEGYLEDSSIGFLLIDGGHSKKDILSDWKNYGKLVSRDGICAIHDICLYTQVSSAWKDIKTNLGSGMTYSEYKIPGFPLLPEPKLSMLGIGYIFREHMPENMCFLKRQE